MNRRHFIKHSTAATAAFAAVPLLAQPAKKYATAIVGTGWWGMNILRAALQAGQSKVVAMCDVDPNQLDPAAAEVEKLSGDKPRKYRDFRELLDQERPEICIVATPDHWHPLVTIAAVKSGAHVYVEKPISHTIKEGRAMVKAARAAGKVVQVGTHRRVSPHCVSGMKFLKEGKAGKIGMVRAFVHYPGGPGQPVPDSEPPPGMDWDLWCGPAPYRPFNKLLHPRGFRQFLDYANGTLGDWGIHWMDQILMWSEEKWPKRVASFGGRHIKRDNTDAPDTQVAIFDFEGFTVSWEQRTYAGNEAEKGENVGCYFYGTEGTFHQAWQTGWTFYPSDKNKQVLHEPANLHQPDSQNIPELWADFLEAILTGRPPVCDIEVGHRSTVMSLLGMLALNTGRSVRWDGQKEVILDDDYANQLLQREYRRPWVYPKS
ncbi:MAG: Gfo/Idh/MocA family oxidoreductase [Verrucomicrobiales bacterium]|nr:Gfo/Idh/MocA family oxidoreductase [Verrucomicrobiales bacterium]